MQDLGLVGELQDLGRLVGELHPYVFLRLVLLVLVERQLDLFRVALRVRLQLNLFLVVFRVGRQVRVLWLSLRNR